MYIFIAPSSKEIMHPLYKQSAFNSKRALNTNKAFKYVGFSIMSLLNLDLLIGVL